MKKAKRSQAKKEPKSTASNEYEVVNRICDRALYLALRMIDIANHHRPNVERGEPKVGGHPSACASSQHILSAIHLVMREPEDYMAFKPHISPMDHALNFLLHNMRDKNNERLSAEDRVTAMHNLRHYSREGHPVFQSYHAESDPDSFRYFPSGSVGIPPVNALYTSLAYQFARDHKFEIPEDPTFWCVMGDSEFREGSLHEAMPDAGERQLGNLIWIVDYNRQNLDGTRVTNEKALKGTDAERICRIGEANGWRSVELKHGKLREKVFAMKGGDELRRVFDEEISDFQFQALITANNAKLIRDVLSQKSAKLKSWLKQFDDEELHRIFFNLGGHDIETLVEAFREAKQHRDRPTLVVAYTIKGRGLLCQALSGNHSALPEEEELRAMAQRLGAPYDKPFAEFEVGSVEEKFIDKRREYLVGGIEKIIHEVAGRQQAWLDEAKQIPFPVDFDISALKYNPVAHTQWMWGQIAAKIDRLARGDRGKKPEPGVEGGWAQVARFFLTMAPDVGSSTNTSPNMNGKLYGDIGQEDYELEYHAKDAQAPDVIPHANQRTGHIRFEIAEGNCMSAAGSFGKFFHFVGIPFYPAMTIYDFFVKRAHDQFYYNLYWHSNFATIGTPSGVTLSSEGAQHSWKSDFQIPHCVTWEPCFSKELEWILADTLKRHFTGDNQDREGALIRCVTKGVVQKELMERLRRQARFKSANGAALEVETEKDIAPVDDATILETIRQEALQGAYPLIDYRHYDGYAPGDNVVHLFAMGALGGEAIKASDQLLQKGIYANVFIVTSPDLLLGNFADKDNYRFLKETLGVTGDLYLNGSGREIANIAEWLSVQGGRIPVVSVHDGEPGLLDNIGSVVGVKQKALAVRQTSKSGTTADIYHFQHIDAEAILAAIDQILAETANEQFRLTGQVAQAIGERQSEEPAFAGTEIEGSQSIH